MYAITFKDGKGKHRILAMNRSYVEAKLLFRQAQEMGLQGIRLKGQPLLLTSRGWM